MSTLTLSRSNMTERIRRRVSSASTITSLLPMLQQCLSLSQVKQIINEKIEQVPESTINSMYFTGLSIDDILSSDVMQHILSFDNMYRPNAVSKAWKSHSDKNETKYLREVYRSTIIPPSQKQSGSTYIIHPKRTKLHRIEKELGYKGPMRIKNALDEYAYLMEGGDRLLIHDGIYTNFNAPLLINTSLKVIGIGENVLFEIFHHGTNPLFEIQCPSLFLQDSHKRKISFENISFCMKPEETFGDSHRFRMAMLPYTKGIRYSDNCNVLIKNCHFFNFPHIAISYDSENQTSSRLNVIDCAFEDVLCSVSKKGSSDLNITNCLFKRCGKKHEYTNYHCIDFIVLRENTKMKCIKNIFEDCLTPPIVEQADENGFTIVSYEKVTDHSHILLKDNKIKGDIFYGPIKIEENVLYRGFGSPVPNFPIQRPPTTRPRIHFRRSQSRRLNPNHCKTNWYLHRQKTKEQIR